MRLKIVLVGLGLLITTACSTIKMNPSVYQKKKLAVATFYGPKRPDMSGFGIAGSLQSSDSNWTAQVLNETYNDYVGKMQQAMGAIFQSPETASSHSMYSLLPRVSGDLEFVSYKKFKPLQIDEDNDVYLGKLASILNVDAVVLVSHSWSLELEKNSTRPSALDIFEIVIVGADGTRLWYQKDSAESGKADLSLGGITTSLAGAIQDKDAVLLLKEATLKSADEFVKAWNEKKKTP